jgi:hypothetical protein
MTAGNCGFAREHLSCSLLRNQQNALHFHVYYVLIDPCMFQYSLLGRSAALTGLNTTFRGLTQSPSSGKTDQFCLRMGTELVPETLFVNELTRLIAQEDYIETCRRESFKA